MKNTSESVLTRIRSEFSFIRGNLLTLIVSWLFVYFTFSLVFSFESPYFRELGAPPFIIGLMGSVGAAMLGLVRIPRAQYIDQGATRVVENWKQLQDDLPKPI